MIRNAILAIGIVLSAASQLRLPGSAVGPGELFLAAWLGLTLLVVLLQTEPYETPGLLLLSGFWVCFAFAMSVGAFVGFLIEDAPDISTLMHDTLAYLLMAAMTCLAVATKDTSTALRRTAWFLVVFWNAALALQVANGWGWIGLASIDPWYWDRFRGWSENPNQLALYCAILVPLSLHLAMTSRGAGRLVGFLCAILSFVVGRLTKSDTFLIAMVAAGTVLVALRLRTWMTAPEHKSSMRYAAAIFIAIAAAPLMISLMPYVFAEANDAESFALSLAKDKGGDATKQTANLRMNLWEQALVRGLESGSLGLGPGPHLERPNIVGNDRLPAPFEAHSTVLDVFMQGGLFAVLCLVGLVASATMLVLRAKLDALVALLGALSVFSISHFIVRHPIVWFAIAFCVAIGSTRAQATPAWNGR